MDTRAWELSFFMSTSIQYMIFILNLIMLKFSHRQIVFFITYENLVSILIIISLYVWQIYQYIIKEKQKN